MRLHEKTGRPIPWYQDIDGFRIPGFFTEEAYRSALKYKPRPDDLFVVTYPKCGTTWVQNILYSMFRKGEPLTELVDFFKSTPFLELTGAEAAEKMKRPGAIKFHLPYHLTPQSPEAKYIFVTRNPKDCVVSFFYHTKMPGYDFGEGTFDDFFEIFINGETDFGDYFDTLLSWYEHRNDPNVLFIKYEDLKSEREGTILKMAEFIGYEYKEMFEKDPSVMAKVVEHSTVKYMKETFNENISKLMALPPEEINLLDLPEGFRKALSNPEARKVGKFDGEFVRKGIVGDWKNHLSEEQNERLMAKFREQTKGTEIAEWWKDSML